VARLWPADTFVGFDEGINTAIRKLRVAFGDSADNPRFIETIPRRGYRFLAPLHEAAAETTQPSETVAVGDATAEVPRARPGNVQRLVVALLAVTLLAVLAGVTYLRRSRPPKNPALPRSE
jgi:DNA-binding winged helix-turn-helix (wHTH) protein